MGPNQNGKRNKAHAGVMPAVQLDDLPEGWQTFIRFCQQLRFGEIERLRIQDGVPVLAETVQKKVKFT
jgi:hypothetical protein